MNPFLITNIPLLKLKVFLLFLLVTAFARSAYPSTACDAQWVKALEFNNKCSEGFMRVKGKRVLADAQLNYTMYTITTVDTSGIPRFMIYDPHERRFICNQGMKLKTMRRIKQNEVFKCLFEEGTNRQDFAHSYIKPFSNGSHQPFNELKCPDCIRFSKRGLQKPKLPDKCANFIIKKLDNECAHSHKTFCDHMRKFKHRLNLASNIRDLCKFNKTSS